MPAEGLRPVRRWTRAALVAGSALLLPCCAVGPDYHGPPAGGPATPAGYKNAGLDTRWKVAEPAEAMARGEWWSIFHDPALNEYMQIALAGNQDLKVTAARIGEARAQAHIAAADLYPQVTANFNAQRIRTTNTGPVQRASLVGANPFAAAAGGAGATAAGMAGAGTAATGAASSAGSTTLATQPLTTTYSLYRTPLNFDWELDLFGRVRRGYEAARADLQAEQATYQDMVLSLTANVAINYFTLRELDTELIVVQNALKSRGEELRIAQERLDAGLTSELDVRRAEADLAGNEADVHALLRTRSQVENTLATLLGEPASSLRLRPHSLPARVIPPRIPPGVPSRVLERRPDVAAAERGLAAANARIGVAKAAFFPRLSLTGEAGFESTNLAQLFNWESRAWQIAANAAQPVFQGGRNLANLAASKARYDEAVAQYRKQVLVAFQEVETALSDLRDLAAQAEAQERATAAARRALLVSEQQYGRGTINFLDVLDAQRVVLADERTSTQLVGQRLQATVNLIKALGGDWH